MENEVTNLRQLAASRQWKGGGGRWRGNWFLYFSKMSFLRKMGFCQKTYGLKIELRKMTLFAMNPNENSSNSLLLKKIPKKPAIL
jgi:hypothetical protein